MATAHLTTGNLYREAVATQSPGLLQPRDSYVDRFNPERVASECNAVGFDGDATALWLFDSGDGNPELKQPWALGRNHFAVL
jgi:hypothetical protein